MKYENLRKLVDAFLKEKNNQDELMQDIILELFEEYNILLKNYVQTNGKFGTLGEYFYNTPSDLKELNNIKLICSKLHEYHPNFVEKVRTETIEFSGKKHFVAFIGWMTSRLCVDSLIQKEDYIKREYSNGQGTH